LQKARNGIKEDEDAAKDTALAKTLDDAWRALFKKYAGKTLEEFTEHRTEKLVHARALLREMQAIGYDDAGMPEYGTLQGVLNEGDTLDASIVQDDNYSRFWALHRAYDRAFSAVYGEGEGVDDFKREFEKRAATEEQSQQSAPSASSSGPSPVDPVADPGADREVLQLLQEQQKIITASKSKAQAEQDVRDSLDLQVTKERAGQPDEDKLEKYLVDAKLLSDREDNAAWRELVASMVEEIRVLRRKGQLATDPDVAERWAELQEKIAYRN
jgi:hypothetical protein